MNLVINVIVFCFIIYAVIFVKKSKIAMKSYLKLQPNKYTKLDILIGFCIGLIAMIGIYVVELNLDLIQFGEFMQTYKKVLNAFFLIALMALGEELLFRGFMLNGLIQLLKNKYIAILITGVLFGLVHANNPNATYLSIISNGLGGVMYSIAFIESESIWLPFALHFSWNFIQGPILGFPVSGLMFSSLVKQTFVTEKTIFTGSGYGPEGGLIGIGFRFFVIAMLLLYYYFNIKKRNA